VRGVLCHAPCAIEPVVRGNGGAGDLDQQATDFRRRYPDWGRYGLSAYFAVSDDAINCLAERELERFPELLVYGLLALAELGIESFPTFRTPHVTLAFHDLEAGLAALRTAPHECRTSPYHEG